MLVTASTKDRGNGLGAPSIWLHPKNPSRTAGTRPIWLTTCKSFPGGVSMPRATPVGTAPGAVVEVTAVGTELLGSVVVGGAVVGGAVVGRVVVGRVERGLVGMPRPRTST